MKKLSLILFIALNIANAEFIGTSIGAGLWHEAIDGYVSTDGTKNYFNKEDGDINTGNLKLGSATKPYVWAKLVHPLPLLPNVKIEYRQYGAKGKNGYVVGNSPKIFGQYIKQGAKVDTDFTMDSFDITAFYEWQLAFDVEAGLGLNILSGSATTVINNTDTHVANWLTPVPYLYASAKSPTIQGFGLEAQGKYFMLGDNQYQDYQMAISYHKPLSMLDFSGSLGYKSQEFNIKDGRNKTDIKFNGAYMEMGARW